MVCVVPVSYTHLDVYKRQDCSSELLTPSPAAGILELREAIARHLSDFRGMKVLPEQIIVGAGTEYLYGLLIQLFGTDQTFAVEDPGYSKIRMIYESHGVDCLCLPLDNEGIHMAALSACNADILHLSPSHHYPCLLYTSFPLIGLCKVHECHSDVLAVHGIECDVSGDGVPGKSCF